MPATESSYLLTKVTVPPLRDRLIPRSRLLERLSARVPLTLLSAGAGYGRTTLLSTWANACHGQVAWLTLEEGENDPLRFWSYILLALRKGLPGLALEDFTHPPSRDVSALPHLLTTLLNTLFDGEEELTLILDDYHLIEEPAIHQSLGFLLEHAPACLHVCLATRTDPPLKLARLRAHGQRLEIREAELRLSAHEAADFLSQTMDLPLPDKEVRTLTLRTEGWITGLQLAALVIRTQPDPRDLVRTFGGTHRHLLDYVQEEILANVPAAWHAFLLHTSILSHLSAPLCTAVTGEEAAAELLETLDRANLFVTSQDGEQRWYHVHSLIREVLLLTLRRRKPHLVPCLHQWAAHWYAEQQLWHEAIAHACEAGNGEFAADLLTRVVAPQSWRNEYHSLRGWLSRLPDEVLHAPPDLSFLYAQALFLTTQVEVRQYPQLEVLLDSAEQGYRRISNAAGIGQVLAARASLAGFQGQFPATFAAAREALTLLPTSDVQWRGVCLSSQGLEALFVGEVKRARTFFQQARVLYAASGNLGGTQFVTAMLAEVQQVLGDRRDAAQDMRAVLGIAQAEPAQVQRQLMNAQGIPRAHFERVAWYSLAGLLLEENRLEEAAHARGAPIRAHQGYSSQEDVCVSLSRREFIKKPRRVHHVNRRISTRNPVSRQDWAYRFRIIACLARAHPRQRRRAQCGVPCPGRCGLWTAQLLWRAGANTSHRPGRPKRLALRQHAHDRALFTQPCLHVDRTQPSFERRGCHYGDGHGVPRL